MKATSILALSLLGLQAIALGQQAMPADIPRVDLIADTVVDPAAWNFPNGKWGTTVNGQTFQQEAVITHNGYQYAAYFADGGQLAIGRRKLPGTEWQVIHFGDYKAGDHRDAHNVVSMGISAGDGTIHLSFDHHNSPMHYRRSVPHLASRPDEFDWDAAQFGPVTSVLEPGKPLSNITYPQFFAAPGGKLQLIYRIGSSGNGDWYLAEYDPAGDGAWKTLGMLLSRQGTYKNSPSRCGYPNPVRYDARGRLQLTWTWREMPQGHPFDLRTNHDILYAYSDDHGRTWHNNAGEPIAALSGGEAGLPDTIGINTPGIIVRTTRWPWGQMNTNTQFSDAKGRLHIISWQHDQDAETSSKDLNTWRYYHYWRATDGTWHENVLPFAGRKPQLVLDAAGNSIVVYTKGDDANYHNIDPGGRLTIAIADEASGWTNWRTTWSADRVSVGEPLLDHGRLAEGILSVYTQDKPTTAAAPSSLRVLDFVMPGATTP